MAYGYGTSKIQEPKSSLKSEKIKKAQAVEADLEARARRRDSERRVGSQTHTATTSSSFSYGRRNGITKLLQHRHGFFCNTADAIVWLETVLPFLVDASLRANKSTYNDAVTWAERYVPDLAKDLGTPEIHRMVDDLLAIRAKPWPQRTSVKGRTFRSWLPSMEEAVAALQIRWEEVTACGLGGWGSIIPPTSEQLLAHDRQRKARDRRAKNIPLRSEMTKTADAKALAAELGRNEKTIRRWRDSGRLEEKVSELRALRSQVSNDNDLIG